MFYLIINMSNLITSKMIDFIKQAVLYFCHSSPDQSSSKNPSLNLLQIPFPLDCNANWDLSTTKTGIRPNLQRGKVFNANVMLYWKCDCITLVSVTFEARDFDAPRCICPKRCHPLLEKSSPFENTCSLVGH